MDELIELITGNEFPAKEMTLSIGIEYSLKPTVIQEMIKIIEINYFQNFKNLAKKFKQGVQNHQIDSQSEQNYFQIVKVSPKIEIKTSENKFSGLLIENDNTIPQNTPSGEQNQNQTEGTVDEKTNEQKQINTKNNKKFQKNSKPVQPGPDLTKPFYLVEVRFGKHIIPLPIQTKSMLSKSNPKNNEEDNVDNNGQNDNNPTLESLQTSPHSIQFPPQDITLKEFQLLIQNYTGILPNKQQIIGKGKKVNDDKVLHFCLAPLPGGGANKAKCPIIQLIGVGTADILFGPLAPVKDVEGNTVGEVIDVEIGDNSTQNSTQNHTQNIPQTESKSTTKPISKPAKLGTSSDKQPIGNRSHPLLNKVKPVDYSDVNFGYQDAGNSGNKSPYTPRNTVNVQGCDGDGKMTSNQLARIVYSEAEYQMKEEKKKVEIEPKKYDKNYTKSDEKLDQILSELRVGKCFIPNCERELHHINPFNCAVCRQDYCQQHKHPLAHQCDPGLYRQNIIQRKLENASHISASEQQALDLKYQKALKSKTLGGVHGRDNKDDDKKKKKK
jgi:hypothetical protein